MRNFFDPLLDKRLEKRRKAKEFFVNCPLCDEKVEKHIICEGSRDHVKFWITKGAHCNKIMCEVNHVCKGRIDGNKSTKQL